MKTESDYLIISNKERLTAIVLHSELDEGDIIDALISLHIILEVSINTLFRHIVLLNLKHTEQPKIIENIDRIGFIEKVTCFIHFSKFGDSNNSEMKKHYSVVGRLKNFSSTRNKLLHGHSIYSIFDGERNKKSDLKESVSLDSLKSQLKEFTLIMQSIAFLVDRMENNVTEAGKKDLTDAYLDTSFLPILK